MGATGCVSRERAARVEPRRELMPSLTPPADFTNVLKKSQIERLAEADEHELVREVQVSWMARSTRSHLGTDAL